MPYVQYRSSNQIWYVNVPGRISKLTRAREAAHSGSASVARSENNHFFENYCGCIGHLKRVSWHANVFRCIQHYSSGGREIFFWRADKRCRKKQKIPYVFLLLERWRVREGRLWVKKGKQSFGIEGWKYSNKPPKTCNSKSL